MNGGQVKFLLLFFKICSMIAVNFKVSVSCVSDANGGFARFGVGMTRYDVDVVT